MLEKITFEVVMDRDIRDTDCVFVNGFEFWSGGAPFPVEFGKTVGSIHKERPDVAVFECSKASRSILDDPLNTARTALSDVSIYTDISLNVRRIQNLVLHYPDGTKGFPYIMQAAPSAA